MTEALGGLHWMPERSAGGGLLIVRSDQTDVRGLLEWLAARGAAYEELVLRVADPQQRQHYEFLCEETGWRTLPMIFADGHFVGGERELRRTLGRPPTAEADRIGRPRAMALLGALGYLSAVPFLLACIALISLTGPQAATVEHLLVGYGAVILSFLGAVHWGRILDAEADSRVPVAAGLLAVMPALVGWGTLLLPTALALPLQAVLFIAIYAVDRVALASLPLGGWYVRLRNRLTTIVVVLLLAAWGAVTF